MTNQPPLNPDALANLRLLAGRATEEVRHAVIEPDILHKLLDLATRRVVITLEELDALPHKTVAMFTMPMLENPVPFELDSRNGDDKYWEQPGDPAGYKGSVMARYLPATIIFTPKERS